MSEQDSLPPRERDSTEPFGSLTWGVILVNGEMYALKQGGAKIWNLVYKLETVPWQHGFEDPDIAVRSIKWARKHQPPVGSHCREQWDQFS